MAAKLHIATVRPRVVPRQRLLDRLSAGARGPLTLVSAPAGTGKTVLASSWALAGAAPGPVAWVTLDDGDDQPGVFWSYVLEAFARSGIEVATVGTPVRAAAVDRSLLVRLAACLSEQPGPVVLVLDRGEQLAGRAVCADLDFLLCHAAPQLRVVLLGRADPPLPLHRYRVAGTMTEIRLADLAFTAPEAGALLAQHDARLSESTLIALTERTKGWAAALRLVAMSLPHRPDPENVLRSLAGEEGEIAEYLLAEVLDAQPAAIRDFLLATSVVDHLAPDLAEALSGRRDAARLLAGLAHQNTFIEVTLDPSERYEYHPLFRDLLRAQLASTFPDRVGPLHRRAARCLAEAGQPAAAARHAIAAGDWAAAAEFVIGGLAIGRLVVGPEVEWFAELFADLPEDTPGPEPAVVLAAQAMTRLDIAASARHLSQARRLAGNRSGKGTRGLWLSIAVVEVMVARALADVDTALLAAATAESVLADLVSDDRQPPAELYALVLSNKGTMLLWAGKLDAAGEALTAGVRAGDSPSCCCSLLNCLGQLALIEVLRGRLRRAAALGKTACDLADRCGLGPEHRPAAAEVALAWVYTEEYDLAAARRHADLASGTAAIRHDPVPAAALAVVRCRLAKIRGDLNGAVLVIGEARAVATRTPMPVWLDRRLHAAEATLRPDREPAFAVAGAVTGRVLNSAPMLGGGRGPADGPEPPASAPLEVVVDEWLQQASRELESGRTERASVTLDRALRLAEPEKLRRPVMEAPPRLRNFLRHHAELRTRHRWLAAATSGPGPTGGPAAARDSAPVVEALTEKELEVLHHLAELLSTEEIARAMFVSVNTVKTHVRSILRKLSASRRNGAIRRARELGLLQPLAIPLQAEALTQPVLRDGGVH